MRQKFADIREVGEMLKVDEVKLSKAIEGADSAEQDLALFIEEMQGDFELMKHKPVWAQACDEFQSAALGHNESVAMTTEALAGFLCETIGRAEPQVAPNATAFIAMHPLDRHTLKVFHAMDASPFDDGATLRVKEGTEVADHIASAWMAMQGEPDLNNAHGLERISRVHTSSMPLRALSGRTFAVLTSGPPAVPDELLDVLGRTAGPLMERVWKKEQVTNMIRNVMEFIKSFTINSQQLVYVTYEDGAAEDFKPVIGDDEHVWRWQALEHTDPTDTKKFAYSLRWRLGEPIGVLRVHCGTFTDLSEQLIVLLHTLAVVMSEAVTVIEGLSPGDTPPLSKVNQVMDVFDAKRMECSHVLKAEIDRQLEFFDASKICAELRHIEAKHVGADSLKVMQAALMLAGMPEKAVKTWDKLTYYLKNPRKLKDQMCAVDVFSEDKELSKRWPGAVKMLKSIDVAAVEKHASAPIKICMRWLQAVTMAHNIALSEVEEAKKNSVISKICDDTFDRIDADRDGFIQPRELVKFMMAEFGSKPAHQLMKVLDSDNDKKIDKEEWRKGWNTGLMTEVMLKAQEEKAAGGADRMQTKRRAAAADHAMFLHAAAQQHERRSEVGSSSAGAPASASASGKQKLKPIKSKK